MLALWFNPLSDIGHIFINIFLIALITLPSIIIHEFAHAIVGKLCRLIVIQIWIGWGKSFLQTNILGFHVEFKAIPVGGFTFFTRDYNKRLPRFKYFLAILAGPLSNAIILVAILKFFSPIVFDISKSIQWPIIIIVAQILILFENLLPYEFQTPFGLAYTDGLSLFQLITSKNPECLQPRFAVTVVAEKQTWTK